MAQASHSHPAPNVAQHLRRPGLQHPLSHSLLTKSCSSPTRYTSCPQDTVPLPQATFNLLDLIRLRLPSPANAGSEASRLTCLMQMTDGGKRKRKTQRVINRQAHSFRNKETVISAASHVAAAGALFDLLPSTASSVLGPQPARAVARVPCWVGRQTPLPAGLPE